MRVSLIITTYNWPESLFLVLKSIENQTIVPEEVVIADDGSTVETKEIIVKFQKDSNLNIIHSWQEDNGFRAAKSRNKAIAKSCGDYIILIDGVLNKHDEVAVAKKDGAVTTKIKAIFMPKPLDEMRDPRDKFTPVDRVVAASGVKMSTSDLDGVLGGSPIIGITDGNIDSVKNEIESEIKSIFVETDSVGIIVKADTLGSLEAVVDTLKENDISISTADTGMVSRKDVVKAQVITETDKYLGSILAFGVKVLDDAKDEANKNGIRIFSQPVLYDLVDEYRDWVTSDKENMQRTELDSIMMPCKFQLIKGMVFRRNGPAVCGVEILGGSLKQKSIIINSTGKEVGVIKQIEDNGENIKQAAKGSEVAVSMNEPVIGRTIRESEILYSLPNNIGVRLLKGRYHDSLSDDESNILDEIITLRRKVSPLYGF